MKVNFDDPYVKDFCHQLQKGRSPRSIYLKLCDESSRQGGNVEVFQEIQQYLHEAYKYTETHDVDTLLACYEDHERLDSDESSEDEIDESEIFAEAHAMYDHFLDASERK